MMPWGDLENLRWSKPAGTNSEHYQHQSRDGVFPDNNGYHSDVNMEERTVVVV